MSSDLITSTMKSEPARPSVLGASGAPVAAAATRAEGRSADDLAVVPAAGAEASVAARAISEDETVVAAPATTVALRNFRRLTLVGVSMGFSSASHWGVLLSALYHRARDTVPSVYPDVLPSQDSCSTQPAELKLH